jgi:hypothetical protein
MPPEIWGKEDEDAPLAAVGPDWEPPAEVPEGWAREPAAPLYGDHGEIVADPLPAKPTDVTMAQLGMEWRG